MKRDRLFAALHLDNETSQTLLPVGPIAYILSAFQNFYMRNLDAQFPARHLSLIPIRLSLTQLYV